MAVFLIDPTTETVQDIMDELRQSRESGEDLLDFVRPKLTVDADKPVRQVSILAVNQNRIALLVDNFGMLKGEQLFWHFSQGGGRLAGRAVMFSVNQETGQLEPFFDPEMRGSIEEAIVWDREVYMLRFVEKVITTPGQMPAIARIPVFSDDPEPAILKEIEEEQARINSEPTIGELLTGSQDQLKTTSQPGPSQGGPRGAAEDEQDNIALDTGWIVRVLTSGDVEAVRYVLEADSIRPAAERLRAPSLAELRKLMPEGYERQEPDDDAETDIIELWVLSHRPVESMARH